MNQPIFYPPQLSQQVFKDKVFVYTTRASVTAFFITAILLLYHWRLMPPVVPLFYSLPWGEEQLSSPWGLWGLWLGLLLLNIINYILGGWLFQKSVYLSHLLWIASLITTFLGLYTLWRIIFLIT